MSIPVICDQCRKRGFAGQSSDSALRTAGTAGTGDFSHLGDLLAFEPVPRKRERVDGWNAERQRAFIAALAVTGSKRRAAISIGMAAFGVDQLLKAPGNDSFKAAYDRAMAIAAQHGAMKLASGVADAAARNSVLTPPSRLRGMPASVEEQAGTEEQDLAIAERLFTKILLKVQQEREARLAGKIAAADFYLRQVTFCEITFELMAEGLGDNPWQLMKDLRRAGHGLIDIAETPMSRLLDDQRRALWAMMEGEEPTIHPPERYLVAVPPSDAEGHDGYTLQPLQALGRASEPPPGVEREAWSAMDHAEQKGVLNAHYAKEAEAQIAYEAAASNSCPLKGED